jgi:hypothetical protein
MHASIRSTVISCMAALLIDEASAGAQIARTAGKRVNVAVGDPGPFPADPIGRPERTPAAVSGQRLQVSLILRGAAMVVLDSTGYSQAPATQRDPNTPDFRVQVWGDIMVDFSRQIWAYFELRRELEKGLPALKVTDDPAETRRAMHALAERIRVARAGAKEGDIFTPAASSEFRKALQLQMSTGTWREIMDDNPGEFPNQINGDYPDTKPLSTVPANVLAVLPRLPDDIQYRFAGRHLILLDTRAKVVLDRIPYAIDCAEDNKSACHR